MYLHHKNGRYTSKDVMVQKKKMHGNRLLEWKPTLHDQRL